MNTKLALLITLAIIIVGFVILQQRYHHKVFFGCAVEGLPNADTITDETTSLGVAPQMVSFYLQWPAPDQTDTSNFPISSLNDIWQSGALPCITWEPSYPSEGKQVAVLASQILKGSYDAYLTSFAKAAKEWGKPLMLRLAHEMNLKEYHWGTTEADYGPASPVTYIQMYRYVVDLFKLIGVPNVLWVFCPNADSVPDDPAWNNAIAYYPGDHHFDIYGIDGYNWGISSWSHHRTFDQIFEPIYHQLKERAPKKPIIIFETASVGNDSEKNRWLEHAIHVSAKWGISGIIWFNVNKEHDWKIHLSAENKRLFTQHHAAQQWAQLMVNNKAKL